MLIISTPLAEESPDRVFISNKIRIKYDEFQKPHISLDSIYLNLNELLSKNINVENISKVCNRDNTTMYYPNNDYYKYEFIEIRSTDSPFLLTIAFRLEEGGFKLVEILCDGVLSPKWSGSVINNFSFKGKIIKILSEPSLPCAFENESDFLKQGIDFPIQADLNDEYYAKHFLVSIESLSSSELYKLAYCSHPYLYPKYGLLKHDDYFRYDYSIFPYEKNTSFFMVIDNNEKKISITSHISIWTSSTHVKYLGHTDSYDLKAFKVFATINEMKKDISFLTSIFEFQFESEDSQRLFLLKRINPKFEQWPQSPLFIIYDGCKFVFDRFCFSARIKEESNNNNIPFNEKLKLLIEQLDFVVKITHKQENLRTD